jgi:hypothetical protein
MRRRRKRRRRNLRWEGGSGGKERKGGKDTSELTRSRRSKGVQTASSGDMTATAQKRWSESPVAFDQGLPVTACPYPVVLAVSLCMDNMYVTMYLPFFLSR